MKRPGGEEILGRLRRGPQVHPEAWVAENAILRGDVRLAARASLWYGVVARGDLEPIEIGEDTNIQDLCMVHVDVGCPARIGARVTAGHRAILHGCTVGNDCLIGMGAVLLSGVRVGEGSLVAAGAVLREGQEVAAGSMVVGVPGRVIGVVSPEVRERILANARSYAELMACYREYLR